MKRKVSKNKRRRRKTIKRQRRPSRSKSNSKSKRKRKTKWKKTKIAVATLATIALALGLYKWHGNRKVPDIRAAEKIITTKPKKTQFEKQLIEIQDENNEIFGGTRSKKIRILPPLINTDPTFLRGATKLNNPPIGEIFDGQEFFDAPSHRSRRRRRRRRKY